MAAGVALGVVGTVFAAGVYVGRQLPVGTVISAGAGATTIHFAPAENLERLDVGLIDQARTAIDMAGYVLTDVAVTEALTRAADRGVKIRLYLFAGQFPEGGQRPHALDDLISTPAGVEVRLKPERAPLMHLKAYQIDSRLLRTGSANFSASGLKRQDNDLIVIESPQAVEAFKRNFEVIWAQGRPSL